MIALRSLRIAASLTMATLALGGCGTVQGIHDAKVATTAIRQEADDLVNGGMQNDPVSAPGVRVLDDQYISTDSIPIAKADDPALQCAFPYNSGKGATLQEIAADITAKCGLAVRLTPDAIAMLNGVYDHAIAGQSSNASAASPAPMAGMAGVIAPPSAGPNQSATTYGLGGMNYIEPRNNKIVIQWDQKLRGFLDALAARTGLNVKFEDGVITYYYLETRTFAVLGIPADTSLGTDINSSSDSTTGLSGGSAAGGGGGGGGSQGVGGNSTSTQKMSVAVASNNLKGMQNTVQEMLTPGVGRMAASFGTITVTDTPDRLGPIGEFIADRNRANTMQARLSIKVLSVQLNKGAEAAFNLNALYQDLAGKYKINIANGYALDSTATSAGVNILTGNARWSGSSAVADFLRSVGQVTTVYDQPITTLNMHAVSSNSTKSDMFVIGTQTTQVGTVTGGIQTSIQQALQTVGLNMTLIPFIAPKGDEVYLQFNLGLSDATPLTSVTAGDSSAQQTHTMQGGTTQSVKLRNGQTLMLMGYRQSGDTLSQTGTGDEHFSLLGGGQTASKTGRYLVILIAPTIEG
jgi:type IVB pilus formation R64 PilN family outer membrane protein